MTRREPGISAWRYVSVAVTVECGDHPAKRILVQIGFDDDAAFNPAAGRVPAELICVTGRKTGFTLVELVVDPAQRHPLSVVVMQASPRRSTSINDQSRQCAWSTRRSRRYSDLPTMYGAVPTVFARLRRCLRRVHAGSNCGRYRQSPPGDALSFLPGDLDSRFEVVGDQPYRRYHHSADPDACADGTATCVVIYNTGLQRQRPVECRQQGDPDGIKRWPACHPGVRQH